MFEIWIEARHEAWALEMKWRWECSLRISRTNQLLIYQRRAFFLSEYSSIWRLIDSKSQFQFLELWYWCWCWMITKKRWMIAKRVIQKLFTHVIKINILMFLLSSTISTLSLFGNAVNWSDEEIWLCSRCSKLSNLYASSIRFDN
jgi:hypothetical protein